MEIKHFFCKHVWRLERTEYLRTVLKDDSFVFSLIPYWKTYRVYAYEYKCLKCRKRKIEEHYVLVV